MPEWVGNFITRYSQAGRSRGHDTGSSSMRPMSSSPASATMEKPGEPAGELYDLLHDPAETRNLYAQEPKRVLALTELLDRYKREGRSRP